MTHSINIHTSSREFQIDYDQMVGRSGVSKKKKKKKTEPKPWTYTREKYSIESVNWEKFTAEKEMRVV